MASRKKPKQHISAGDETGIAAMAATGISTFDDTHVAAQNAALESNCFELGRRNKADLGGKTRRLLAFGARIPANSQTVEGVSYKCEKKCLTP